MQIIKIIIEEGSDETVESLKKKLQGEGWDFCGYDLSLMREKGSVAPCPIFSKKD